MVSAKYDYVFKSLMANETVRKYFLSDVLNIPLESIKYARLVSPFLWKRYARQKQGILDILLILNDDTKVNIELQIIVLKYWDRRCMFYLAKMFTEDLLVGENYIKLKKCISISILDFDLDKSAKYHRVYHMRDEEGVQFSDLWEIHIVELGKKLDGSGRVDDWIRLINAETEKELSMIKTGNAGIMEAISELKQMSLSKRLRALYDARMKEIRDRNARDEYVRDEGIAIGESKGECKKLIDLVRRMMIRKMSAAEISELLEEDNDSITNIYTLLKDHPDWDDEKIYHNLH